MISRNVQELCLCCITWIIALIEFKTDLIHFKLKQHVTLQLSLKLDRYTQLGPPG